MNTTCFISFKIKYNKFAEDLMKAASLYAGPVDAFILLLLMRVVRIHVMLLASFLVRVLAGESGGLC